MRKLYLFIAFFSFFLNKDFAQATWNVSGCGPGNPSIDMILIDACGNEGETEFVIFTTGTNPYDPSSLSMMGSSLGTSAANFAGNLAIAVTLNSYVGACSPAVFVAAPNPIPPNSKVIAFPSSTGLASLPPPNLAAYCGTGPIYVLSGDYGGGTNGFFVNGSAGCVSNCLRTLTVDFGGGCTVTSTYDRVTFPTGNGVNIKPGGVIANPGDCFPPPPFACNPPAVPSGYPCSGWTVLAYENGTNLNFTTFKGYYNTADDAVSGVVPTPPTVIGANSFSFDTSNDGFVSTNPISDATGYTGCPTANDGFSIWAKKTCFPCAYYKIFVKDYDDNLKVIVDQNGDGVPEFTSPQYTFGQVANTVIWEGFLNASSKVDLQALDWTPNGGIFNVNVAFLNQNLMLSAANNGPKCPGQTVNLTSTLSPAGINPTPAFTYSWSGPGGFTANTQNTTNTVGAGTYTVTLGGAPAACPVTATTTVVATNINFTAPPNLTICAGLTTTPLGVTGTPPPSGSATYTWSGPGLSATNIANPTATPPSASTPAGTLVSNYAVTVTDGGCNWTGTFTITTVTPPTPPNVQTPINACTGQQISLTTNSVNTGLPFPPTITQLPAAVNFNWTGPNGFVSNTVYGPGTLPYSVTATAPNTIGTFTYNLTLSTSLLPGCTTAPIAVTVNVAAPPTLTPKNVCSGLTLDLNTMFTGAAIAGTWSGVGVSGSNFISTALPAGNYNVTFTPTGSTCSSTGVVTVLAGLNPNTTQTGNLCGNSPYTGTVTLGVDAGYTSYTWSAGVLGTGNSVTVNSPSTYTVTVSNGTCSTVKSFTVNANPNPTPIIQGPNTLCNVSTATLTVSPFGFSSYTWDNNGAAGGSNSSLNISGPGTFKVTVTDAQGCVGTTTKIITASSGLSPQVTGNLFICGASGSTQITISNGPYNTYGWFNSANQNIGTANAVSISAAGTYTVTVSDVAGCTGSLSFSVTQVAVPTVAISGTTQVCQGATTTLSVPNTFTTYKWDFNNSNTSSVTVPQGGPYSVTVTNANGCTAKDSKSVTNYPAFSPTIAGSTTICAGASTTLDAGAGYTSYSWTGGATTQTATFNAAGTYSVTVTNSQGCKGTASVTVTLANNLVINITGKSTFCPNGKTTLSAGAGFTSYSWSNSATTQSIDVTTAGVYSVTVSNGSCTGSASITVTESTAPKVTIVGDSVICAGATGNLMADNTFTSYNWTPNATSQSISYTTAQTYKLTVTDANGCTATDEITPVVNPIPVPGLTGTNSFCEGKSTDLSVTAGFSSYLWSNGNTTDKITVTTPNTYKVTVTNNNCSAVDSIVVTENPNPIVTISKDTIVCEGIEVQLDANAGAAIYKWSSGENTPSINVKDGKTYVVTVTSSVGCSSIDSVKLTVNPVPKPVIDAPNTICIGEKAIFKLTEIYDSYLWSNSKTTDTIQVNDTNLYSVTVTSKEGCTGTTSKSISIKNNLAPSIVGKSKFCDGATITLGLDDVYATYLWSDNTINDSLKVNQTGTYSVTVTSASGCKGFASFDATEVPNPTPSINGSLIICAGKPSTLSVNGAYNQYLWSNTEKNPTITADAAGTYSVTVTNTEGCTGEASVVVTENNIVGTLKDTLCKNDFLFINGKKYDFSNPSGQEIIKTLGSCDSTVNIQLYFRNEIAVNLTSTNAICKGQKTNLTVNVTGFTGVFDLTYQDENGVKTTLKNVQNGYKIPVSPTTTSTYKIVATSIVNGNCGATLGEAIVSVNEVKLNLLTSNYSGLGISCFGKEDGSINVTASQGSAPYQYLWKDGKTDANLSNLKAGKYQITVTDAVGCVAEDSVELKQADKIAVTFKVQNPLCASSPKGSIILSDISGGSGSYTYSTNGTQFSTVGTKPFSVAGLSPGNYILTIKDTNGCSVSDSATVEQGKFIKVDLGEDKTIAFGDSVVITPTTDFQMKSIQWSNAQYLSCATCQFPFAKPKVTTGFNVTVYDENGCSATDNILVFVITPRNVFIPTVFTPGSDGNNDYFRPFLGTGVLKVNFFRIYDRWGDVIYEDTDFTKEQSQEPTRGWNGYYKGKDMNSAVFTYAIEVEFVDGVKKIYKGDVSLVVHE